MEKELGVSLSGLVLTDTEDISGLIEDIKDAIQHRVIDISLDKLVLLSLSQSVSLYDLDDIQVLIDSVDSTEDDDIDLYLKYNFSNKQRRKDKSEVRPLESENIEDEDNSQSGLEESKMSNTVLGPEPSEEDLFNFDSDESDSDESDSDGYEDEDDSDDNFDYEDEDDSDSDGYEDEDESDDSFDYEDEDESDDSFDYEDESDNDSYDEDESSDEDDLSLLFGDDEEEIDSGDSESDHVNQKVAPNVTPPLSSSEVKTNKAVNFEVRESGHEKEEKPKSLVSESKSIKSPQQITIEKILAEKRRRMAQQGQGVIKVQQRSVAKPVQQTKVSAPITKVQKDVIASSQEQNEDDAKKYDSLDVESLFKEVENFLKSHGVQKKLIDRSILDSKFGKKNINKLASKSYLVIVGKRVTIGIR